MRGHVLRVMVWGVAMLAVLSPGASSAAEESETLVALLQEVRLLRQAMERSSEFVARSQLLTGQLSVQERRLARAQSELDGIDRELASIVADQPRIQTFLEELERTIVEQRDPERRQQIEFELKQMQAQFDQLRTRERELSSRRVRAFEALEIERNRYEELDNRLYQLERELVRSGQ